MKQLSLFCILTFLGFLVAGCQPQNEKGQKMHINPNEYLMQAVLWQQNAAEYRALCYQAFNIAKFRLDKALSDRDNANQPPAIVTDIDETILDNSPFEAKLILRQKPYSYKYWLKWVALKKAKVIPGAKKFLQYAQSKGVTIFYVSNRNETAEAPTIANLKRWELPFADRSHVLLKKETAAKKYRFEKVDRDYNILMFMGDNCSDFLSTFRIPSTKKRNTLADSLQNVFGKKFIVLPNPMYGDWVSKGIFQGKHNLTETEKDSIRKTALKAY